MIVIIYIVGLVSVGLFGHSIYWMLLWNGICSALVLYSKSPLPKKEVSKKEYVSDSILLVFGWIGFIGLQQLLSLSSAGIKLTLTNFELIGYLFYTLFFAPVLEELLIRHYVFSSLVKKHRLLAYFGSSCLFALLHGNLIQLIPAFFMGLYFAYVYESTNQLGFVILLHICYNLCTLLFSFWQHGVIVTVTSLFAFLALFVYFWYKRRPVVLEMKNG